jgi:hypothetical protein
VNRRRRQAALVLVAFCVVVPSAAANGDPASDVLPTQNIYLPYEAPSAAAAKTLKRAVEAAYARHFRVKVAVIANQIDLGDVPSLWGKPNQYARFLGTELDPFYVGPLLIVMPAGFGVYDGGRSVAAEERILGSIAVKGADSDSLTSTAADVVTRLLKARALRSKDAARAPRPGRDNRPALGGAADGPHRDPPPVRRRVGPCRQSQRQELRRRDGRLDPLRRLEGPDTFKQ